MRLARLLVILLASSSAAAFATSMLPVSLEDLLGHADDVVRATVLRRRTSSEADRLFTHTALRITRVLKGDHRAGDELVLRQAGGVRGVMREGIVGDATFTEGEEVVIVLRHGARYHFLTDLSLSKFRVEIVEGKEVLVRDTGGLSFAGGAPPGERIASETLERALTGGAR